MGSLTLGFDVYGTLVDPLDMQQHLKGLVGEKAAAFSQLWREKQLEYTWRRSLMQQYEDFEVCTRQALEYTTQALEVSLTDTQRLQLLDAYQRLPAYPEVIAGLTALGEAGHRLYAFSNGTQSMLGTLLEGNGVLRYLDDVVSVDEVGVFKPAPETYWHLAERTESVPDETWLISSNPFDVIGAKAAGIRAAWLRRDPKRVFDPWGVEPDLTIKELTELLDALPR